MEKKKWDTMKISLHIQTNCPLEKKCILAGMRSTWALEKTAQYQLQAKLQYGEVESDGVNFSKGKFPETIGVRMDGPY